MFLFHPIYFLKFLVKCQPRRSYKRGSCKKKECIPEGLSLTIKKMIGNCYNWDLHLVF